MKLQTPVLFNDHKIHKSGKMKSACVTACLTAIGVPVDGFSVTGDIYKANYLSILNRHGYSTRSRKSKMPKTLTIGACRKAIIGLDEDAVYFVILYHKGYCHAIVLDNKGRTRVDTDPRKMDKRKVYSIHAVTKMK